MWVAPEALDAVTAPVSLNPVGKGLAAGTAGVQARGGQPAP